MRSARLGVSLLCSLLFCGFAHANLIVNGGFESSSVNQGGWRWFYASDVKGWEGSNIEVWDHLYGFAPFEGSQHAELNAHPSNGGAFSIYQTFDTQADAQYSLSFAYAARRNTNESFLVELISDTGAFWSALMDDHLVRQWSEFSTSFAAQSAETTLRFTSVTPLTGTVGNLLDAVSVLSLGGQLEEVNNNPPGTNGATPVNAPSVWSLSGLGMLLLILRRRRQA